MVRRSHGLRVKTRHVLRKDSRDRGMPPASHSVLLFEEGEKASIVIQPSIHKGMPHRRFQGLTGVVVGRQGRSYLVKVRTGSKNKVVLARPEHLKKVRS